MKPRLLDLFCCAGGCSMGYNLAGFDVTGVDIEPQKHYPFRFIQADAMTFPLDGYDVVHASPPCQGYSSTRFQVQQPRKPYVNLLPAMRERLRRWQGLWVIENVPGAPMESGIVLCGSMFGLNVLRHRHFESNLMLYSPGTCRHPSGFLNPVGGKIRGYGSLASNHLYRDVKGNMRKREGYYRLEEGKKAMGIDWNITLYELSQAIPPLYTKFVGQQLLAIA